MCGFGFNTYLCLACCSAFLLLSSSSLLLASSSWVRGLGAGFGGIAGSWMKGCDGWTWADDELGMADDTEEGLLRSWAETQGWTAPGRSTDVGRGDSLLAPVLLELLVLPLEKHKVEETPWALILLCRQIKFWQQPKTVGLLVCLPWLLDV